MSTCPLGPAGKTPTENFRSGPPRSRAPAPSVNERSLPARPATGGTESTPVTGKVAAELRAVTSTSMPAQLLRPATSNHPFITHAARVAACGVLLGERERAVERSEERLNTRYPQGPAEGDGCQNRPSRGRYCKNYCKRRLTHRRDSELLQSTVYGATTVVRVSVCVDQSHSVTLRCLPVRAQRGQRTSTGLVGSPFRHRQHAPA